MVSKTQPQTPSGKSSDANDNSLLGRARLALKALQLEEEAARYRVACAELMEAIADAESGNPTPLRRWLLARSDSGCSGSVELTGDKPREVVQPAACATPQKNEPKLATAPVYLPSPESEPLIANASASKRSSNNSSEIASHRGATWARMANAAEARTKAWLKPEQVDAPELVANSLKIALETGTLENGGDSETVKKKRTLPHHIIISIMVHGLMLFVLGWWVVAISQPENQMSISVGQTDDEEFALETTLEQEPSEMSPSEDPESAPESDMETLPIDVPKVAAIENGVGPPAVDSNLTTMTGDLNGAGGMGTNLASGAEFFGAKAAGNTFVFVVDCSPSMARDKAFESAKAEILRSLSMLKPKQRFFILFFGGEIAPLQFAGQDPEPYMLRANPENLEKTMEWIQRIPIQKEGRHPIDAVQQAIEMEPDAIFLLFDGDTKVSNWTGRIREMNRTNDLFSQGETKIPIHVVHFFREEFVADMKRLAGENEGSYRFVPRPRKGANR